MNLTKKYAFPFLIVTTFATLHNNALAETGNNSSYPAKELLSTSTTILGQKITYPTGDAHVTAAIVTMEPGARTILHKHDVPLFAYILEGELTVDYGKYGTRIYKQGQSLIEAIGTPHFGVNTGTQTMRLIGVYMGAQGAKDVTPIDDR